MKIEQSFTDLSSLQTCSCSTCTCSNEYLKENDDCLTYMLVIIYEGLIWCIGIVYELFFKSFYQIVQVLKEDYPLIALRCNTEEKEDPYVVVVIPVRSVYCQTELTENHLDSNPLHHLQCQVSSRQTQTEPQLSNERRTRYSSVSHVSASLAKSSVAENTRPFFFERIGDGDRIPLGLPTSPHSNASLDNVDYFISKYIRQLFTDKQHLQ